MSIWATPQDVINRWVGPGVPTDETLISALIDDAEAVVLAAYPLIQDRIDEGKLSLGTVVMVVSRMVTRLLRNPEAVSYWQQTTGPFGQARNFGDNTDIWLSDNERALLSPNRDNKAFSFNMAPNQISPDYAPFKAPGVIDPVWKVQGGE
jgi:hypothetical protein